MLDQDPDLGDGANITFYGDQSYDDHTAKPGEAIQDFDLWFAWETRWLG